MWFVGDSADDMACGKLAGCSTCLITTGTYTALTKVLLVTQRVATHVLCYDCFAMLCSPCTSLFLVFTIAGTNNHVVLKSPELVDVIVDSFDELAAFFKLC